MMVSIGVRDQFCSGGRGEGGEVSCPNIFSSACPKNQKLFPNIICSLPENGHLKNYREGGCEPPPPPPRLVRL